MNKEEILAKSRKENNNEDLVSEKAYTNGNSLAGIMLVCIAVIYLGAELVINKRTNYGIFAFVTAYLACVNYNMANELNSKRKKVASILYFVLTIGLMAIYILQLLGII